MATLRQGAIGRGGGPSLVGGRGKGRYRKKILIGCVLNISVLGGLDGLTGSCAPRDRVQRGPEAADLLEKRSGWTSIALEFGLSFWNTMPDTRKASDTCLDDHCTWRSSTSSGSQIDFFLGEVSECVAWGLGDPAFRSDHCVLWCEISYRKKVLLAGAGAH